MTDAIEDHEGTVNIGGRTVTNFHFAVEGEAKTDSFFLEVLSLVTIQIGVYYLRSDENLTLRCDG